MNSDQSPMADKMDSDRSFTGESESTSSSSDSTSSGSTDGDEEALETIRILGHTFNLPQSLCEDYSLFKEVFSMKTFEFLEDTEKEHLKTLLPTFKENDKEEKDATLKMLFDYEPMKFTSPFSDFYNDLKLGNFRPDLLKMRKLLVKARKKQQRQRMRQHYAKLLPAMLLSRERLLAAVKGGPPGPAAFLPRLPPKPTMTLTPGQRSTYQRAKQRYFDELNAVRSEVGGESSEDDNFPEGPDETFSERKPVSPSPLELDEEQSVLGTLSGSTQIYPEPLLDEKEMVAFHKLRRLQREVHPELNINGITLDEIEHRVYGGKKIMFGIPKSESPVQKLKRGIKRDYLSKGKVSEGKTIKKIKEENEADGKASIKCENESDSESSSFVDPGTSPKASTSLEQVEIKQEVMDDAESENYHSNSMDNYSLPAEIVIKEEPGADPDGSQNSGKVHIPIKLEDLDGIDMMDLPIQLADETSEDIRDSSASVNQDGREKSMDESLTETTHASFLSLVRALFPARDAHRATKQQLHARCGAVLKSPIAPLNTWYSCECPNCRLAQHLLPREVDESLTDTTHARFLSLVRALFPARDAHRATKQQLHARCGAVLKSPIAPLNTWYSLSDDWLAELDSALEFLTGERGSHPDDFVPYLQYMQKTQTYQWIGAGRDCDLILDRLCDRWLRAMSPRLSTKTTPPPKYPTSWTVRPPTGAEISDFRTQERRRFTSASKPFTYVQHGYRSVVGPCARAWVSSGCAGTSLLLPDRPRHATFTSLVRDALARLPNGEGTRHDVLTLLKMSQYVAQSSDQALLGAVSAVLERFHTAKRDPVVKFDHRTAVWTYLHRNRTEEDWIKTSAGRTRKPTAPLSPTPSPASPPAVLPRTPLPKPTINRVLVPKVKTVDVTSPPPLVKTTREVNMAQPMEVDAPSTEEVVEASDSDVDVDDTSLPSSSPQLSSAQLLMQATLGQKQPTKAKRLTYTPPSKRTYTSKQLNLAKQQNKAALMSQSVKQAKILAEAVKQASATSQNKANLAAARSMAKQAALLSKASTSQALQAAMQGPPPPKMVKLPTQSPKAAQSPKQPPTIIQLPTSPMHPPPSPKQMPPSPKQVHSPGPGSPLQPQSPRASPVRQIQSATKPAASAKQPPIPGNPIKSPSPKPHIGDKQLPQVYLTKDSVSITGKDLKLPNQKDMKPHVVFLAPQSPVQSSSPKQSPQSPKMAPPQTVPSQTLMPPPAPPPPQTSMPPPQSPAPQSKSIVQGKLPPKLHQKQPPLIIKHFEHQKPAILSKPVVSSSIKTIPPQISIPMLTQANVLSRSSSVPTIVAPHKSPLIKHRTIKSDAVANVMKANALGQAISAPQTVIHPMANSTIIQPQKMAPGTRSLLIRPPSLQTPVTASMNPTSQVCAARRGVVRVLSPANPSTGKSLISPRALLHESPTSKKRVPTSGTPAITTLAQSPTGTVVVSCVQTAVSPSAPTRTVQLAGGRTLQISANQTVHFPGGQAVQLSPSHALQLSSLQLQPTLQVQHTTHSVRLPSGQTVPLATPQVMQALKASKAQNRVQTTSTLKPLQANQTVIPVSSVQLGQTVQFGNQTVQLAGQSVQLTGHTVKLPSGQSVQVASPNVLPQNVQLGGQTFQIAGGSMQAVQMGQNVIPSGMGNVQLNNQTVQLAGSQTVQLPSGQTIQLPSGQTLQLASGVQLAGQPKMPQVVRSQSQGDKAGNQPIMAKLLTNAQGQVVPIEGMVGGSRIVSGVRPRPQVRVISPAARLNRPLLLTSAKPLHNIILQSDGTAVRVTSTGGASTAQTIVISNMSAQTVTTPTTAAPVLKLQQGPAGTTPTSSGVRSVLMDGQQLKLVSGRHVLARILRPNHPPPQ